MIDELIVCAAGGAAGLAGALYVRARRADPRMRRNSFGVIYCPQCRAILTGIFPEWRFCKGPEAGCFDSLKPHFHGSCTTNGCDWKGIVKP